MEEFIKLIERYETITLKEIEDAMPLSLFSGEVAAKHLTRFGTQQCTLCVSAFNIKKEEESKNNEERLLTPEDFLEERKNMCGHCVYYNPFGCQDDGENYKTYYAIFEAETPEELLKAFRNRAKLMRRKYL